MLMVGREGETMSCRQRLEQLFATEGVRYQMITHPTAYTAQEVAAVEHVSGYRVAKVIMAAVDSALVMLVLPAPHRVDLLKLRKALGVETARLAREDEFAHVFPDCELGAMPPFGNLYGIAVYVDESLAHDPQIVFNAGSHRETMTVAYADFERLARPLIADISTAPSIRALP
jgi:Ala-tRNA(Pro) deacylase